MKKLLISAFCLLHLTAIFWWTLPHSFGGLVMAESEPDSLRARLFKWMMFEDKPGVHTFLHGYIDATGNQQYWDFFAPQSPKYHQYLSVCAAITATPEQEIISCKGKPLFSNLEVDFASFRRFGSDRSRLYRLTENLAHLENPQLLKAFTQYYQTQPHANMGYPDKSRLVLHQFELHPELKDLPKPGYRVDKLLFVAE